MKKFQRIVVYDATSPEPCDNDKDNELINKIEALMNEIKACTLNNNPKTQNDCFNKVLKTYFGKNFPPEKGGGDFNNNEIAKIDLLLKPVLNILDSYIKNANNFDFGISQLAQIKAQIKSLKDQANNLNKKVKEECEKGHPNKGKDKKNISYLKEILSINDKKKDDKKKNKRNKGKDRDKSQCGQARMNRNENKNQLKYYEQLEKVLNGQIKSLPDLLNTLADAVIENAISILCPDDTEARIYAYKKYKELCKMIERKIKKSFKS